MTTVVLTGVHKSFGKLAVLRGADLRVPTGGLTAVLGPSGCGKTTLLRLIAGFEVPDAGTITIGDQVVCEGRRGLPPERRGIGYVAQEGALFPHLTVAANIGFGLPWRARRARERVGELLDLVGMDAEHAHRYPHQLSGGQQQRVALARALAPRPPVVLLDEPFSALDAGLRADTRRAVADALAATGTTAVLVTHDQAEALSMAQQIAVMREGRIVQTAAPADVYAAPADLGVAAFVGDSVVLPGIVSGREAECVLGRLPVGAADTDGPALLLLRPEQILIRPAGAGIPARVEGCTYYGHDAIVRLRLGDGGTVVTARCSGHTLPCANEDVAVTVTGEALAYPKDPGESATLLPHLDSNQKPFD